jgi:pyruvate dehydrogenase E1 component alpha subunit
LKSFETEVCDHFREKRIRAPIHLDNGNEQQLIDIFKHVKKDDWVLCTWRSHYKCLLKGIPRKQIIHDIHNCKSISLCFPEHRFFSSAIVGGNIPIANGIAFDIKRKHQTNHVWCFVGEMTAETGCFHENWKYAMQHDLPITFIIEDNYRSVCTDTRKIWNTTKLTHERENLTEKDKIIYFSYCSKYPHSGVGERIQF